MSNNNSFFFNSILMGIEPCDDFVEDKTRGLLDSRSNLERKFSVESEYFMPSERKCFFNQLHSDVKTSSFSSRRGKTCFLVYMTHSTITTPRFLPASANPEKGNCKAVVKYTSYFCTLWALWGFDCILYYYFFNILLELLLTHSPPPNHPEMTITLAAINQLSSKNTLFDCVTVRTCEDK